jgi:hypothetical protein
MDAVNLTDRIVETRREGETDHRSRIGERAGQACLDPLS